MLGECLGAAHQRHEQIRLLECPESRDRRGDHRLELGFFGGSADRVGLHFPLRENKPRVSSPRPEHVGADDFSKLLGMLRPQSTGDLFAVGNEPGCELRRRPERIRMPSGHSQAVDQGIDIPEAVLDRRRGQHEHILERPCLEGVEDRRGHLRWILGAVEVSHLVRFVENQHVESRCLARFEETGGRVIRGDDHRLRPAGDSPQLGSRGSVGLDAELRVKLLHPLIDEDLWADDEDLGDSIPLHELADDQAGADRLSEPHVVGEECHGKPPAEPHQVLHLVAVWLDTILPVSPRFDVLGRLDDDRLSERPFQRSAVEAEIIRMLCRRQFAGDDLGFHDPALRPVRATELADTTSED